MHGSSKIDIVMFPIYLLCCVVLLPVFAVVGTSQLLIKMNEEKRNENKQENDR